MPKYWRVEAPAFAHNDVTASDAWRVFRDAESAEKYKRELIDSGKDANDIRITTFSE